MRVVTVLSSKALPKQSQRLPNVFHTLQFNSEAGKSNYNTTPHKTPEDATDSVKGSSTYPDFVIIEIDPN